jgi:tetratricopeptide (TPR) repeat protein
VREQRAVDRHETENPVAYDHYLQGLRLISERRRLAVEENDLALAAFEKAIALDPNYSGAYAGLGWAKWLRVEQIDVFDEDSRQDAFRLARKSIELNDNAMARRILAREHLSVLNFWVSTTKNVSEAVAQLEQAYALQPNNSDILADLALVLSFAGQPERALRLSKEAMERNPNHPAWYFASSGIALLLSGDAERALSDLSKWNESDQLYGVSYIFLAAALANAGRKIEANTMLHRFEELSNTITLSSEQKSGPFEIRITSYAVKRRWPMQPAQEKVFIDGLKIAGMRDIQG